jgi:hypothetical protein
MRPSGLLTAPLLLSLIHSNLLHNQSLLFQLKRMSDRLRIIQYLWTLMQIRKGLQSLCFASNVAKPVI